MILMIVLLFFLSKGCGGKLNIKDGEIQTSKKYEMDEHGVGIKNIIEVITKYQGSYAIRNDNNEFYFSVILPN